MESLHGGDGEHLPPLAVVGTGLIGTSIAMAGARAGLRVHLFDPDERAAAEAAERSGGHVAASLAACVGDAGVAFVCVPVARTAEVAVSALDEGGHAVVTDVASVKLDLLAEVEGLVGGEGSARFVGGHPMSGSEGSGPRGASATMFEGAPWILTPLPGTAPASVHTVSAVVTSFGSRPIVLEGGSHDEAVARLSHVPQVLAAALALVGERGAPIWRELAGRSFREMTRVAASPPGMWLEILSANRGPVVEALDELIVQLDEVRSTLTALPDATAWAKLRGFLEDARTLRLGAPPAGPTPDARP
jgi:prephenate dehydrogenase